MFNRVYTIKAKLPTQNKVPELEPAANALNRCFGQLTLIQYLLNEFGVGDSTILPNLLETYPTVNVLPQSHMGIPSNWESLHLWKH